MKRNLSEWARKTLRALAEVVLPRSGKLDLDLRDYAVDFIDHYVGFFPTHLRLGFPLGLLLLEFGPILYIRRFKRFSKMKLEEMNPGERAELVRFILENHEYRGEGHGFPIARPFLKQAWGNRPILNPKSFATVLEGMNLWLDYMIMNELHDQCPFLLEKNICQIYDLRPWNCSLFPRDPNHELRTNNYILNICKGIKEVSR